MARAAKDRRLVVANGTGPGRGLVVASAAKRQFEAWSKVLWDEHSGTLFLAAWSDTEAIFATLCRLRITG